MAHSEAAILRGFLLPPAPLNAIITPRRFAELFPTRYQENRLVRELYRELRAQRDRDRDDVKSNIDAEVEKGKKQRRHVAKVRKSSEAHDFTGVDPMEAEMEAELFSAASDARPRSHTLRTVQPAIEQACTDIEVDICRMEAEIELLLKEIESAVGDLSDLRYGRFAKVPGTSDDIGEDALLTLKRLQAVCQHAGPGPDATS